MGGRHYQLTDAVAEPKPVQQPLPLLIGGKGDRMMGVVARHADQWNMWGLPDAIAERSAFLDRRCEAFGRDPAEITRSAQALVWLTDDPADAAAFLERTAPRPAVAGTIDHLVEVVAAWHAVGLDELIVPDFTLGQGARKLERMDAIIESVRPAAA
jgi:alkanesulfonate monooxygenase SsuD/methylene tetrahydromethanopterin reductase-like flavin-dependent oxidoreductase (luciferase family)